MPNQPKKIIPNANNCASFNEIKHRQNYYLIRTGAFTYAMVHLVSRATQKTANGRFGAGTATPKHTVSC
jgi:hypothetical protein